MADKKPSYWERRALDREMAYQEGSGKTVEEIQRIYEKAFNDLEARIKKTEKKLDALKDDPDRAAAFINQSAELTWLEDDIYDIFAKAATIEKRVTTSRYTAAMQEGYYRTLFDIQKGVGAAYSFNLLPKRAIDAALNANWLNHNYSESIWKNSATAAAKASEIIISGLAGGRSNEDMADELARVMQVETFCAERLIRTETNYFSNQGELEAYKESGLERYRFLATLDNLTFTRHLSRHGN